MTTGKDDFPKFMTTGKDDFPKFMTTGKDDFPKLSQHPPNRGILKKP